MTCGLVGGIEIRFLASGISVTPYSADIRSGTKEFSYAKLKISREDGERVANIAREYEPVWVILGNTVQDRYIFHPEAVDLHNEDADLTLYDAEKILERGTLSNYFDSNSAQEIINFILDEVDDPNGAITGRSHDTDAANYRAKNNQYPILADLVGLTGNAKAEDNSIKFDEISPRSAMKKLASRMEIQTRVDRQGVFRYGLRGAGKNAYTFGPGGQQNKIKEYNVAVGSGKVSEVIVKGRYRYTRTLDGPSGGVKEITDNNVYSYGRARLVDESGTTVPGETRNPDVQLAALNPKGAEQTARRWLVNHYMGRKNGDIVINAGASKNSNRLAKISVGDIVAATGEIEKHCDRQISTGIFLVQNVKHELDNRKGWLVTIEVAALPNGDINSSSWLYNPEDDVRYEDIYEYGVSNDAQDGA